MSEDTDEQYSYSMIVMQKTFLSLRYTVNTLVERSYAKENFVISIDQVIITYRVNETPYRQRPKVYTQAVNVNIE